MNCTTRLLIPLFLLFTVATSQPVPNVDVLDASISSVSKNINGSQIETLPVNRNVNGLLTLAPGVVYPTDLPSSSSITGTSQFVDGSELQVLVSVDGTTSSLQIFDLKEIEAISVVKKNASQPFPRGLSYGGNANAGVINIVTKSGATEFSQGRAFNPAASKFKSAKFPNYYAPEKDFPLGVIGSAGVSGDGSASFQIINFPGDNYFFFRNNNSKFRPIGDFMKFPLGNTGYISSGSLSNRIDTGTREDDVRFFAYRQYFGIGTSNLRSQVRLEVRDADTFDRIRGPFNFTPLVKSRYFLEEQSQSVEIEPRGAFLAFTRYHAPSDRNLGYIRGISLTGPPQGKQKLFTSIPRMRNTDFGITGLDVIPVTPDVSPEPE